MPTRRIELKKQYDIVIVGGGIQGATLAWEAARNGLSTLLVDSRDFGSGTSANNLKVIHGGIRYIQNLNLKRTVESIRERDLLLTIAPHLVRPMSCSIPAPRRLIHNRYTYGLAFHFYDLLNRLFGSYRTRATTRHHRSEVIAEGLLGAELDRLSFLSWQDAQVSNAERLVYCFIQSARRLGGDAFNYLRALDIDLEQHTVVLKDCLNPAEQHTTSWKYLVDCSGPWCNDTAKLAAAALPRVGFIEGVNLYVNKRFLHHALGLQSYNTQDSRLFYATPWDRGTLIGTWYYRVVGGEAADLESQAIEECLHDIKDLFPGLKIDASEVALLHRGRLPMRSDAANNPYTDLAENNSVRALTDGSTKAGYFSLVGVKYTTARSFSSRFMQEYITGNRYIDVFPDQEKWLLEGGFIGEFSMELQALMKRYPAFSESVLSHLLSTYGEHSHRILEMAERDPKLAKNVPGCSQGILAELVYSLEYEDTYRLSDLLVRRTGLAANGFLSPQTAEYTCQLMQDYFDWSDSEKDDNLREMRRYMRQSLDHVPDSSNRKSALR